MFQFKNGIQVAVVAGFGGALLLLLSAAVLVNPILVDRFKQFHSNRNFKSTLYTMHGRNMTFENTGPWSCGAEDCSGGRKPGEENCGRVRNEWERKYWRIRTGGEGKEIRDR